jgi:hypothetical protein
MRIGVMSARVPLQRKRMRGVQGWVEPQTSNHEAKCWLVTAGHGERFWQNRPLREAPPGQTTDLYGTSESRIGFIRFDCDPPVEATGKLMNACQDPAAMDSCLDRWELHPSATMV